MRRGERMEEEKNIDGVHLLPRPRTTGKLNGPAMPTLTVVESFLYNTFRGEIRNTDVQIGISDRKIAHGFRIDLCLC